MLLLSWLGTNKYNLIRTFKGDNTYYCSSRCDISKLRVRKKWSCLLTLLAVYSVKVAEMKEFNWFWPFLCEMYFRKMVMSIMDALLLYILAIPILEENWRKWEQVCQTGWKRTHAIPSNQSQDGPFVYLVSMNLH